MSSGAVSSFHSSSDCPTAHVSRRHLDDDDEEYSASSTGFHTAASRATPLSSEAFASPVSHPLTENSMSYSPTPTTARQRRKMRQQRPAAITILSPVLSPSQSSSSIDARSVEVTRIPDSAATASPPLASATSPTTHYDASAGNPLSDGRVYMPPAIFNTTQLKYEPAGAAAAATGSPALAAGGGGGSSSGSGFLLSPRRRAVSSPTVPTSRGPRMADWNRRGSETGSTGAGSGTAGSHALPPLPPLRPPSQYVAGGSKAGTPRLNASSADSLSSQANDTSPRPTVLEGAAAGAGSSQGGPAASHASSWWAAARRFGSDRRKQVNEYLETLINPGAAELATHNAQVAAAEVHANRAAAAAAARDGGRASGAMSLPIPGASSGASGRYHSRSVSGSSGFDGAFDATRRSPPTHAPYSSRGPRTMYEPYSSVPRQDSGAVHDNVPPLDVVVIDPSQEPFVWNDPTIQAPEVRVITRDAANDSFNNVGDVSNSDVDDYDGEPNTYVVDLISALRGYNSNPTEPFGHLVAAALASRSAQMPVRGFEIAAAEHNPFLVRMIVDSGTLEVEDEEVQRNVQDTVDSLVPSTEAELSPAIYEYLDSFFKMPFVRLSHGQYALLKRSGFEYIKLMYDHQHVLPDEPFHSILLNESRGMHLFNIIFMAVELFSIIFCTVTIALVLAVWMTESNGDFQSFGFYTLIVFGGGWALYLIAVTYVVRSREDEQRYEPQQSSREHFLVPSPYVAVVPVLPLFDILCLISYGFALKKKRIILGHNIVASSRVSGIFYSIWFAFPQLIAQSYFNNIETTIDARYRQRWAYTMLIVAVVVQWSVALLGCIGFLFTHDSINGFGFACFNMGRVPHLLERHNAAAHTLHYLMVFLLETNVYLVAADTIARPTTPECSTYSNLVLALSAFSVFYMLVVFLVISLTDTSAVRISFSSVPLLAVQVALNVCSERVSRADCTAYRERFFRKTFVFGYLSWGAYFCGFLVWLILMCQWCFLCGRSTNCVSRIRCPLWRKEDRAAESAQGDNSAADPDAPSPDLAEQGRAHTM